MNKNGNVIPFPKEQTLRARLRERGAHQRSVLALSILSVLMLSVFSNQLLTGPATDEARRGLASVGPLQNQADLKWEHRMAQELATQRGLAAHFAEKPSLRDELVFGVLQGRYAMHVTGDRVRSLELIRNQESVEPLKLGDVGIFLMKYRRAFSVSYQEVSKASSGADGEIWNLIDDNKTIVGTVKVQMDEGGRLTSLTVQ